MDRSFRNEAVKLFMLERTKELLNEAYKQFLAVGNLMKNEEKEDIKYWKQLNHIYHVKRRMENTYKKVEKGSVIEGEKDKKDEVI